MRGTLSPYSLLKVREKPNLTNWDKGRSPAWATMACMLVFTTPRTSTCGSSGMMSYNTGVLRQRLKRYTLNARLVGSESKKGVSYVKQKVKKERTGHGRGRRSLTWRAPAQT